jgi:thiamine-phosphate pyrophosphorylase
MLRYAITPGVLPIEGVGPILDQLLLQCEALADEGVEYLLVREKQLAEPELEEVVRKIVQRVRGKGTRVIVAGSPALARAAGAYGVHLGSAFGEESVRAARAVFPGVWISCSCHKLGEVESAWMAGVDGVLYSPIFGKVVDGVEVTAGIGLSRLRAACAAAAGQASVFALGGITRENALSCCSAGASGVAGIRMFFGG